MFNGYQYMAMTNYPYPASFLEPMPAWPVNEAVKPFVDIPTAAELAEEKSKTTEAWAMRLIRTALGFFGVSRDRTNSMLSYFTPQNLTPV